MTLEQMLIRLAETHGVLEVGTDGQPALPSDNMTLERLKRAIQDGIGEMQAASYQWHVLRPVVEITVGSDSPQCIDGDPTRYALPWNVVGQPGSGWSFHLTGSAFRGSVFSSTAAQVAEFNASGLTGPPQYIAVVPGRNAGEWEMHLAPAPDAAYTFTAQASLLAFKPAQLYQRSPFGAVHDQTVLAAARWNLYRDDFGEERRKDYEADFEKALARSIEFDKQAGGAQTLGAIEDPACRHGYYGTGDRLTPVTHLLN